MRVGPLLWIAMLTGTIGCHRTTDRSNTTQTGSISGFVKSDAIAIEGARIRVKGTRESTVSNRHGRFMLPIPESPGLMSLTAWKKGYFIGGADLSSHDNETVIDLTRHPNEDYADYEWVDPSPNPLESQNCANCHREIFDEWNAGAHARSASGMHFLNLYAGSDWHGNADRGWSLLRDYPHGASVCSSCHAPSSSMDHLVSGDLSDLTGVERHGVHCDFCHKIQDVSVENLGITHGRFAVSLLRPKHEQLFFGPLDDVDRGEDVFSILQSQSQFCSACHEGVVFGVHVYSTFSEWLASPARKKGQDCQDCHMKPSGKMTNIAPGAGGIERDPSSLASHSLFPGGKEKMIRECLDVDVTVEAKDAKSTAIIKITTKNVGHAVPTGYIDRHLILVVEGFDKDGGRTKLSGNQLPQAAGDLSGLNGRIFAKRLFDEHQNSPIPFWQPALETVDTRLLPESLFTDSYSLPANLRQLDVRIIYRRFWHQVYIEKNWPNDQMVVFQQRINLGGDAFKSSKSE